MARRPTTDDRRLPSISKHYDGLQKFLLYFAPTVCTMTSKSRLRPSLSKKTNYASLWIMVVLVACINESVRRTRTASALSVGGGCSGSLTVVVNRRYEPRRQSTSSVHSFATRPPMSRRSRPTMNASRRTGRTLSSAPLSSSSLNDESRQPDRPQKRILQKMLRAFQKVSVSFRTSPRRFRAKFQSLSRRAKILLAAQLLMFTLVFGSLGKTVVQKYYNPTTSGTATGPPIELPYSSFLSLVEQSGSASPRSTSSGSDGVTIDNVKISPEKLVYRLTRDRVAEGQPTDVICFSRQVAARPELIQSLQSNGIPFSAATPPKRVNALAFAARSLILGFYVLILWRMYSSFNRSNGGSGDVPGKLATGSSQSFSDIQGIDDAKNEVVELVDTLRNPDKYSILGARAPTGLLLEGPPGTGKTMLARATAATAGVPLLYASGSDFVEMFVGRGAARVRKLFERATKLAPCIIFIDELDALGKSRDSGSGLMSGRGNDEAEQTLNQLLACMDGLDSSRKVIVLAATNRREVLDPALVRPGRFDRIVRLDLPDAAGRERILRVHAARLPGFQEGQGIDERRPNSLGVGDKIDLSAVAAVTPGFSGAELEFIVNEAAIRAVRRVSSALREGEQGITPHVTARDFEGSLESFFATRRPKDPLNDMWKNVWRSAA